MGCLVLMLLWTALGYLTYRIIPVYLEKDGYHDDLLRIAGRATVAQWTDRRIVQQVLEVSKGRRFEVTQEDIEIRRVRNRPEVILIVNYRRTEEFPGGYIYVFHFRSVAEGSLGL